MSILEKKIIKQKKSTGQTEKTRKFRIYKRVFCSVFLLKKYRYQ